MRHAHYIINCSFDLLKDATGTLQPVITNHIPGIGECHNIMLNYLYKGKFQLTNMIIAPPQLHFYVWNSGLWWSRWDLLFWTGTSSSLHNLWCDCNWSCITCYVNCADPNPEMKLYLSKTKDYYWQMSQGKYKIMNYLFLQWYPPGQQTTSEQHIAL